jgi:Protein of unknown function (DUF2612)
LTIGYGDDYGDDYGNPTPSNVPDPSYYSDLITSQYQNSPKLMAWMGELLQKVEDVTVLLQAMDYYFDIDNATGAQLDIVGQIVFGNKNARTVNFQPSGGVSPVLDDSTFRLLLKAKIIQNHWDGRTQSLYDAWQSLFPGGTIIINDSQDMTCVITMAGTFSSIIQDLINNGYIVPRPQGVLYTYGFATLPFFGCDREDAFIAGCDVGNIV